MLVFLRLSYLAHMFVMSVTYICRILNVFLKKLVNGRKVAYAYNHSTYETEPGRSLWVQGQSGPHREFKAHLKFAVRPHLRKTKTGQNPATTTKTKSPLIDSSILLFFNLQCLVLCLTFYIHCGQLIYELETFAWLMQHAT